MTIELRVSIDRCEAMDYTPAAAVDSGDVVKIGDCNTIILTTVNTDDAGSKLISALLEIPSPGVVLAATVADAWIAGAPVYWDFSTEKLTDHGGEGDFVGYALEPKIVTTESTNKVRFMGFPLDPMQAAEAPFDIIWEEDFMYNLLADRAEWTSVSVGDGTTIISTALNGGVLTCLNAGASAASDGTIYFGDSLLWDIDTLKSIEIRAKVITPGAGVAVSFGMTGDHDLDLDTLAQAAIFRLDASLALKVETDDGTNNNDDAATAVTLTTDVWYWFKIDFTDTADIRFLYRADGATEWIDLTVAALADLGISEFDMSNYSAGLQPRFSVDKASGTNTGQLSIDFMRIRSERS